MAASIFYVKFRNKLYNLFKMAAATSAEPVDYNSDLLVNSIIAKTKEFTKRVDGGHLTSESFRTLSAVGISSEGVNSINVIDFGGGAGGHFAVAKKAFPEKKLNWLIVETPKMASLCIGEDIKEITFVSTIKEASSLIPKPDLVIMNASIHYTEDPIQTLLNVCDLGSSWIFVTRTPLTDENRTLSMLQESRLRKNGPGRAIDNSVKDAPVIIPIKVMSKSSVEKLLSERYKIMLAFEEENLHVNLKNQNVKTYGYLCKLKLQQSDRE
jgi:putative methyltransferase (TIGR04325 family)